MAYILQEHKLETTYNADGSRKTIDKWTEKIQIKAKAGWRRTYMDTFDIYDNCVSNLENKMARYLIENIKTGFVLEITYQKLMAKFKISDKKAKTFLKKMKDIEFIYGGHGIYKTNPFMFVPYKEEDDSIASSQELWKIRHELKLKDNYDHI